MPAANWELIKAATEERAAQVKILTDINAKAEADKRGLDATEQAAFDAAHKKAEEIGKRLENLRKVADIDTSIRQQDARPTPEAIATEAVRTGDDATLDGFKVKDLARYSLIRAIRQATAGRPVDGIEGEVSQELAKRSEKTPRGFFFPGSIPTGPQVRAIRERRDMTETSGSGFIATILDASNFIELLRNRIVCMKAGARMLTDLRGNLALPKQTGGATVSWVADDAAPGSETDQTTGQVTFSPKTVAAYTDMSRLFIAQTSISAEAFVRNDLALQLGIEIDRAMLNGSGSSGQPTGLMQQGSLATVSTVSSGTPGALTYANMLALEEKVANANADLGALAYVTNSKVRAQLKAVPLKPNDGSSFVVSGMLWSKGSDMYTGECNGYPAYVSNNVPSNLTAGTGSSATSTNSAILYGNWNDMILALWSQLDILVDPYSRSTAGAVRVVAMQDVDTNVRHIESFAACLTVAAS